MQPFEPNPEAELDAELRGVALPPGLHGRLRRTAWDNDEGLDAALRSVPLPAGLEQRLQQVVLEDDEVLDDALREVAIPRRLHDGLRRVVLSDDEGLDLVVRDVPFPVRLPARLRGAAGGAGRLAKLGHWVTAASLLAAIGLSYVGAMMLMLVSAYPQQPSAGPSLEAWAFDVSTGPDEAAVSIQPFQPEEGRIPDNPGPPAWTMPALDVQLVSLAEPSESRGSWPPLPANPWATADMLGAVPLGGWRDSLSSPMAEFDRALSDLDRVFEEMDDPRLVGRLVPCGVRLPRVRGAGWAFQLEYGVFPRVYPAAHPLLETSVVPLGIAPTSYELARSHLKNGELPYRQDVRVEEFLAAIDYRYPEPRRKPLGLFTAAGPSPFSLEGAKLLQIGVQGRRFRDVPRRPATLVLAVDVSGSMRWGDRLGVIRRAMPELARRFGPDDRISLVRFNQEASTLVEGLGPDDAEQLLAAADSLVAGGSTNVGRGLGEALAVAHHRAIVGNRAVRVVLLSDGLAGLERQTADRIESLLAQCASRAIVLEVIDLGQEGPDAQLASFARAGGGTSRRAVNAEQVRSALLEILSGRSQLIAEDVQLSVVFNPKAVLDYRLLGHEEGLIPAPLQVDFHAGQSDTALYEVRLKPGGGSDVVATVELKWLAPGGEGGSQTLVRTLRRDRFGKSLIESPLPLQAAAIAAQTAELLRRSPFALTPPGSRKYPSFDLVLDLAEQLDSRLQGNPTFVEFVAMVERAATARPYRRSGTR